MVTKDRSKFNFIEWNNRVFVSSIKRIRLGIILIIILDILFYAISALIVTAWYVQIKLRMEKVFLPSPESLASLGVEKAQQASAEARTFLLLLVFSIILVITMIIFAASIIKGIIWAKTTGTKITLRLISKFLALNLIWITFWLVLLMLIPIIIEPRVITRINDPHNPGMFFQFTTIHLYVIVAILISSYFTNLLYAIFMRNKKLNSIWKAIKMGILKIHLFLVPYIIIFLLFYVIIRLIGFLRFSYSTLFLALIAIAYAAVVRYYSSGLVMEIEELRNEKINFSSKN